MPARLARTVVIVIACLIPDIAAASPLFIFTFDGSEPLKASLNNEGTTAALGVSDLTLVGTGAIYFFGAQGFNQNAVYISGWNSTAEATVEITVPTGLDLHVSEVKARVGHAAGFVSDMDLWLNGQHLSYVSTSQGNSSRLSWPASNPSQPADPPVPGPIVLAAGGTYQLTLRGAPSATALYLDDISLSGSFVETTHSPEPGVGLLLLSGFALLARRR